MHSPPFWIIAELPDNLISPIRIISCTVISRSITTHSRIRVAPAAHQTGTAENIADEGIPPRSIRQANRAHIPTIRTVGEVSALSGKPIAEERQINSIAMGIVAVNVLGIVSFEQNMMRSGHVLCL